MATALVSTADQQIRDTLFDLLSPTFSLIVHCQILGDVIQLAQVCNEVRLIAVDLDDNSADPQKLCELRSTENNSYRFLLFSSGMQVRDLPMCITYHDVIIISKPLNRYVLCNALRRIWV